MTEWFPTCRKSVYTRKDYVAIINNNDYGVCIPAFIQKHNGLIISQELSIAYTPVLLLSADNYKHIFHLRSALS